MKTATTMQARGVIAVRRLQRGLSLIEIMVTIVLLSVIILGLLAMFDQTRRAFTGGLNQVDMLEAGRSAMDLIQRDVEQMVPAYQGVTGQNFCSGLTPGYTRLLQPLTDPNESRTNSLQTFMFVTKSNLQWTAIGYKVDPSQVSKGVGTLYRYSYTTTTNFPANMGTDFVLSTNLNTNYSRVIDGVVTLRVRAYTDEGRLATGGQNVSYRLASIGAGELSWVFWDDGVPGYVEIEVGILESRTLERWRSFTNTTDLTAANNFLQKHAGQVHVFRQRIPIRAVDPNAY